jgi:hypothetical protein
MNTINVSGAITKEKAAQLLGLKVFDTALPQVWLDESCLTLRVHASKDDEIPANLYDTFLCGMVWCYDVAKIMGEPVALTETAYRLLTKLAFWNGRPVPQQDTVLHIDGSR